MHGEVGVGPSKDGREVIFEGAHGSFCCIASVATRWYQFALTLTSYELFHGFGYFIVEYMFLGNDVGPFEA